MFISYLTKLEKPTGNECNLFHAHTDHTQIDLHSFNNYCYNLQYVTNIKDFWGETAYVCYLIHSVIFFFLIEPYQHSWYFTKPNKSLLTSSSRLFTDPQFQDFSKTRRLCHRDLIYLVSFHHPSTILEKLGWKSFITLLTHNSGGIFIHALALLYWYRLAY